MNRQLSTSTAIGASAVSMQPSNLHSKSIECNSVIQQPFSVQSLLNKAKNPAPSISIVSGMSQSLRKPIQKDQVCTFEYFCENRSLGIALGIGHHDLESWETSIQANGVVYYRKSNGDFFKIEEFSNQQDSGLSSGDEVLTINDVMLDNYSLEDVALVI